MADRTARMLLDPHASIIVHLSARLVSLSENPGQGSLTALTTGAIEQRRKCLEETGIGVCYHGGAHVVCADPVVGRERPFNTPMQRCPSGASGDVPITLWYDHSLYATLGYKRALPLPFTAPAGL